MNERTWDELASFLRTAMCVTFAGDGTESPSQRPGFIEFSYAQYPFEYRDSYAGYLAAAGQEIVWYKGTPVWSQSYGGRMQAPHSNDLGFVGLTYSFLKQALARKERKFQPRGPESFASGNCRYESVWIGSIEAFSGEEKIYHQGQLVCSHFFFDGAIVHLPRD